MRTLAAASSLLAACILLVAAPFGCGEKTQGTGDPAARLREAWSRFQMGEFTQALLGFEAVAAATPETDGLHAKAVYGLAATWDLRRPDEDHAKATQLYNRVLQIAPKGDAAAWSLLALARMKHLPTGGKDPDYRELRQAYQTVIERFPGHLAADEAFVYQQSTLVAELDPEIAARVLARLQEFLQARPDCKFASSIHGLMADCYATLDRPEDRVKSQLQSLETLEVDPTNPYVEKAWNYWQIATVAEFEAGEFDVAREYYGRLIRQYPKDIHVYAAKQAIKRMDAMEKRIRDEAAGAGGKRGGG